MTSLTNPGENDLPIEKEDDETTEVLKTSGQSPSGSEVSNQRGVNECGNELYRA